MGAVYSKVLRTIGDPAWESMPWKHFKSVSEQAKVMPTFAAIEWTYRIAAWSCLLHASKTGGLPMWFSAWLCGTANDIFFMFMPFCDNFWQAQASVMITPRLPLYIVEMYATVIYFSSTAARQFNLPYLSEAALTGLLAHLTYHPYDILGPPNLWWTWHDGDPCISERHNNAPYGSSIWILTYISLHQLLLRFCEFPSVDTGVGRVLNATLEIILSKLPELATTLVEKFRLREVISKIEQLQLLLNKAPWIIRIGWSGLVCTPMFMSLMGVFQILSLDKVGIPGKKTYRLIVLTYLLITGNGFYRAFRSGSLQLPKLKATASANRKLLAIVLGFYAVLISISKMKNAKAHISTGCHQTYGKSHVVKDIMGFSREDFVHGQNPSGYSKNDYVLPARKEDGTLDASGNRVIQPKESGPDSEWYTVKGKERVNQEGDERRVALFSALGVAVYTVAFLNLHALPSYI